MSTTEDRNDPDLSVKDEKGMQKKYLVLSEEEREKGFTRPLHVAYTHMTCGAVTTISKAIAETYARDPKFYTHTYCTTCRDHFPVGEDGEFIWTRDETKVGT